MPWLIGLWVILTLIGLINLYSATLGQEIFFSQLRHTVIGAIFLMLVAFAIPIGFFNHKAYSIFAFVLFMLFLVIFVGDDAGGSQRWIKVAGFRWQPSEFAKISVALLVARYIYLHQNVRPYTLKNLLPLLAILGLLFFAIFIQPDLGTAGACLIIATCQIAFLRLDIKSLSIASIIGLVTVINIWIFGLRPYQKLRVLNLFNPDHDPTGSGYNALQSLITIGSGGLWGKGYLQGTQTHLKFLPARHTDFIFSVFAEEHGFLSSLLFLILIAAYIYIALEIARYAKNVFSMLAAIGVAGILFSETLINIAMVLGAFPVVGIPLPFFSYGGSSLLLIAGCTGILIAVDRESKGKRAFFNVIK